MVSLTRLKNLIKINFLSKAPVCPECGTPMMKSGFPTADVQAYKCRLKCFTGHACKAEKCENRSVGGSEYCPTHLNRAEKNG